MIDISCMPGWIKTIGRQVCIQYNCSMRGQNHLIFNTVVCVINREYSLYTVELLFYEGTKPPNFFTMRFVCVQRRIFSLQQNCSIRGQNPSHSLKGLFVCGQWTSPPSCRYSKTVHPSLFTFGLVLIFLLVLQYVHW